MEKLKLEEQLLKLCTNHKVTVGIAESCTGGALAARITQVSGASDYFVGSIVSYTNQVKTRVLGVSTAILLQYGAVSVPVALLMLEGVLLQLSSDLGVAVTGVAGPNGGTIETPVGTIFIAVGGKGLDPQVVELHLEGNRQAIIQQSVDHALSLLIDILKK
jgi:PncC family amidohydrolase